jgi:uncharacterized protein YukE
MVTDKQLRDLNQLAYGVEHDYELNNEPYRDIVVNRPIPTSDGQKFQVIATQNNQYTGEVYTDPKTGFSRQITGSGFQGMAVAPIINGKADLSQVIIVAAGTDSREVPFGPDGYSATGRLGGDSGQYSDAKAFVKDVMKMQGVTVTQLSGYSQSAYMLGIGADKQIQTVVFNGYTDYKEFSDAELEEMRKHPEKYANYSFAGGGNWLAYLPGSVSTLSDYRKEIKNGTISASQHPGLVLIPGGSHAPLSLFNRWFQTDGNILSNGKLKNLQTKITSLQGQLSQKKLSASKRIEVRKDLIDVVADNAAAGAANFEGTLTGALSGAKGEVAAIVARVRASAYSLGPDIRSEIEGMLANYNMDSFWDSDAEESATKQMKSYKSSLETFGTNIREASKKFKEHDENIPKDFLD